MQASESARLVPILEHVAYVSLQLLEVVVVGDGPANRALPDGVQMQFVVHGSVEGPRLKGTFPKTTAAFLRIDRDGVGLINVRAPLRLHDGAWAELDAAGRYDFGLDGYQRALKGELSDSDLGWCPRLTTGDERYSWLNRLQLLGVGRLRPQERRVDYELFAMRPSAEAARSASNEAPVPRAFSSALR